MAAAATTVEPKEMECAVCHEDFTDPKILPCAHLLCRDCLVTWIKSDNQDQCPLCRCIIVDPTDKATRSCEDIADALPTDLAMAALVESAHILSKDHVCQACVSVAATYICLHCGDMLCQTCTNAHGRLSATRHHKTESLSTMTPERLSVSRPASCTAHTDRPPELYCPTHGASVCLLCATTEHRTCPDMTTLETKVKEARTVLEELVKTLTEGEKTLEKAISALDQHLLDIDKHTQKTVADVEEACNRLESSVRACRKRMKELAQAANADMKAEVHGGKAVLMERRGKLTSHKRLAVRVQETTPPSNVGQMTSTLQTRVTELDFSPKLPNNMKVITRKTIVIDPQAVTQIAKALETLGRKHVELVPLLAQPSQFLFHHRHGKNIELSDDRKTAMRVKGDLHGIVFTADPMTADILFEVKLVERGIGRNYFRLGSVDRDPGIVPLHDDSDYWSEPACTLRGNNVKVRGKKVMSVSNFNDALMNIPVGTRVGLLVDSARCLHLYKNGTDLGVIVRGIAEPCYAYFDLQRSYQKITALPLTCMK